MQKFYSLFSLRKVSSVGVGMSYILDLLTLTECVSPFHFERFEDSRSFASVNEFIEGKGLFAPEIQMKKYIRRSGKGGAFARLLRELNIKWVKCHISNKYGDIVRGGEHSDEYRCLLSLIEKYFQGCNVDGLIICLDEALGYDPLVLFFKNKIRCDVKITVMYGGNKIRIYKVEKVR